MQYMMKSGVLYQENAHSILAKMKSAAIGSSKRIYNGTGELLMETEIRYLDNEKAYTGDVRNKEYILTNPSDHVLATAAPGYAEGDDPDVVGWPICRMPRVDHADVAVNGTEYLLTMHNSQNYSLKNINGMEVLRIMHKGIVGGWSLEDSHGFAPEVLCGIFAFCRYIEKENEFLIV